MMKMRHYLFSGQKMISALYLLTVIVFSILEVMLAYIMSKCMDLAVGKQMEQFFRYGLLFLIYIAVFTGADYFRKYLCGRILMTAQISLRKDMIEGILKKSVFSFHRKNTADYLSALSNDTEMIGSSCFQTVLSLFPDMLSFIISFISIFFFSWQMALYIVFFTVLSLLIPRMLTPRISAAKQRQSEEAAGFSVAANEHMMGFDLLHSYHLLRKSVRELTERNRRWEKSRFRVRCLNAFAGSLSYGFSQIVCIGLYFFGALLVVLGKLTVGEMIAVTQLAVYVMSPLQTFSSDFAEILSCRPIMARLEELLEDEECSGKKTVSVSGFTGLKLEDVSCSYGRKTVLKDLSFTFEKGKKYVITGPSGSGKSTLVRMMTGSLRPAEGTVMVNNTDISEADPDDYAKLVSVCSQNTVVFDDTLRSNISLYADGITDRQILDALHRAGFDDILSAYRNGLDERISQSGGNLSGGEKQRIALARMFLFETPLVILDETFSNLDGQSMHELLQKIISNRNQTLICIGHNLPEEIMEMFDCRLKLTDQKLTSE